MKDQENKITITEQDIKELQKLLEKNLKERSHKKLLFNVIWQTIVLLALGVISLIILSKTTDIFKNNNTDISKGQTGCSIAYPANCQTEEMCLNSGFSWDGEKCLYNKKQGEGIKNAPSEYPDFDYYNKLSQNNHKLVVISSVDSNAIDGKISGRQNIKIKTSGKCSSAYLYINASVDNGEPLTTWDSIYTTLRRPHYKPIGGHIFRPLSIKMPKSNTTELLFDLRQAPYTFLPYSENNQHYNADWFTLLNSDSEFELETFLSTSRSGGKIIEISLAYECEKDTPDCKIQTEN